MEKTMKVQFFNRTTGKTFILPTPYTDRVEACVCGQNYCRDRQQEDGTELFYRVIVEGEYYQPKQEDALICDYDEEDCDDDCYRCGLCCEDEDSEEPDEEIMEEIRSYLRECDIYI